MKKLLMFLLFITLTPGAGVSVDKTSAQTFAPAQQQLSREEEEAKLAIEKRVADSVEALRRKDMAARMEGFAPDWTGKLKDGEVIALKDLEGAFRQQFRSIINVSEETRTIVDSIQLNGNEATVHTSQRFVRTVQGNDG